MPDVVIKNGTVIDGTGAPGFAADVAVTGDRIEAIEPNIDAGRLDLLVVDGVERERAVLEHGANGAVGEEHRSTHRLRRTDRASGGRRHRPIVGGCGFVDATETGRPFRRPDNVPSR